MEGGLPLGCIVGFRRVGWQGGIQPLRVVDLWETRNDPDQTVMRPGLWPSVGGELTLVGQSTHTRLRTQSMPPRLS